MSALVNKYLSHCNLRDSHQHHIEERAVFAGCGVRAVGTNECVSMSGTGNADFRIANQYSRPQPITLNIPEMV